MTLTPDEQRIIGLSGPILLRMLKAKEERLVSRMYGEFRNGKTDHTSALAELATLRELSNEINNAITAMTKEK